MKKHLPESITKSKVSRNREKGHTGRLYLEQAALIRTDQGYSKVIEIHLNMKQRCVIVLIFFNIFKELIFRVIEYYKY